MAKLADAAHSKSAFERSKGSTPFEATKIKYMDKVIFLTTLIEQETKNALLSGSWVRPTLFHDGSKHNDYWTFDKPGVDGLSLQLELKNDGLVEYTNYDESDEPKILTYQEFLDSEYYTK